MKKFEIKSRFSGGVLFALETESRRLCIEAAVKSRADLSGANLSGAILSGTNLSRAILSGANLSGAILSGVNLSGANLSGVNLSGTNLSGAILSGTNLSRANLSRANLYGVNLSGADLSGVNLSGVNLSGVNLSRAKNAELVIAQQAIVPSEGAFVGWKQLRAGVIARLVIPPDAARVNAIGSRKARASKVFVHELFRNGAAWYGIGEGLRDPGAKYEIGKETISDKYDGDNRVECSSGIHFFLTRVEAENYSD